MTGRSFHDPISATGYSVQNSSLTRVAFNRQLPTRRSRQALKPDYDIALSDWFHPPVIHAVTRQSGRIRVNATDSVQVVKVLITILDEQEQTLEQGEAATVNDAWWDLETAVSTEGKVIVQAFDLADNCTKHEA